MLSPSRQRGFEYLDDPALPANVVAHSLRDIARANRHFGGTNAVLSELPAVFRELRSAGLTEMSLLDVGTGLGDIPVAVSEAASARGLRVHAVGIELTNAFAMVGRQHVPNMIAADARALPLADNSIDVVTCSLVLHHLEDEDAVRMLRECDRVARRRVIVAELRRSWVAIALLWVVSFPLRFHAISRHDGVVSIRRGFLVPELRAMVARVTGAGISCRARLGWRVTAAWNPGTSRA